MSDVLDTMGELEVVEEDRDDLSLALISGNDLYITGSLLPVPDNGQANDALCEARINEVARIILAGFNHHNVVTWVEQNYNVGRGQARKYWVDAREMISAELSAALQTAFAENLFALRGLRLRSDDPAFQLKCLIQEARVLGLGNVVRVEHTGRDGGPIQTQTLVTAGSIAIREVIDVPAKEVDVGDTDDFDEGE